MEEVSGYNTESLTVDHRVADEGSPLIVEEVSGYNTESLTVDHRVADRGALSLWRRCQVIIQKV